MVKRYGYKKKHYNKRRKHVKKGSRMTPYKVSNMNKKIAVVYECWTTISTLGAPSTADVTFAFPFNEPGEYAAAGNAALSSPAITAVNTIAVMPNVPIAPVSYLYSSFDEYKVDYLEIIFYPAYINTAYQSTEINPNTVYIERDLDDVVPSTQKEFTDRGIKPIMFNSLNPIKRKFVNPLQPKGQWFNTALPVMQPNQVSSTGPGWAITSAIPPNYFASVKMCLPNISTPLYQGRLYVRWYITFRSLQ